MATNAKSKEGTGCLAAVLIGVPVIALLIVLGFWTMRSYNKMVEAEEAFKAQWARVETNYQLRMDLVGNLVSVVKGYANHEESTLVGVIEARSKATAVNVDASKLSSESLAKFEVAQDGVTSALSRLLVTVEQYPDLKANTLFQDLSAQLRTIEDNILVERNRFNADSREFNTSIRKFPRRIFAWMFGFEPIGYFKADSTASSAPRVEGL